jgi:hypothetical protein
MWISRTICVCYGGGWATHTFRVCVDTDTDILIIYWVSWSEDLSCSNLIYGIWLHSWHPIREASLSNVLSHITNFCWQWLDPWMINNRGLLACPMVWCGKSCLSTGRQWRSMEESANFSWGSDWDLSSVMSPKNRPRERQGSCCR